MFTEYALNALLKQTYARHDGGLRALFALPPRHLALHTRARPAGIYHDQAPT